LTVLDILHIVLLDNNSTPTSSGIVTGQTYSAVVKMKITTIRRSLMDINAPKVPNNASNAPVSAEIMTLKTRIWHHARTKNGFILDIEDPEHDGATAPPNHCSYKFYGAKFLGKSGKRYMELYPSPGIINQFTKQGVLYTAAKIQLLPCQSIQDEGKVIQLDLSDIPPISQQEILTGLTDESTVYPNVWSAFLQK
jgi:hypothetical protein